MMEYTLEFTKIAHTHIELKLSGDIKLLKRLQDILIELIEHPKTGIGKPEQLKHDLAGCWSRRLSQKHRVVYKIEEKKVTVVVLYVKNHYYAK